MLYLQYILLLLQRQLSCARACILVEILIFDMRLFIFLYCTVFSIALFAQGPISGFLPGAKTTDIALGYSFETYDSYFFGQDKREQMVDATSYNLFVEHGISSKASLVLNLPYIAIDEENSGLQDATIALKYRNQRKEYDSGNLNFITAVGLTFPISSYPKETVNAIGAGAFQFQGRLVMQYNWNYGTFLHIQSGFDFQLIPVARTSIPIQVRAGMGASKFYFDVWMEYMNALNAGVDNTVAGGEGSSWFRVGGTFYYPFTPDFGAFLGGAYVLSGENIGQSSRINTGVVYKWNRVKKRN